VLLTYKLRIVRSAVGIPIDRPELGELSSLNCKFIPCYKRIKKGTTPYASRLDRICCHNLF